MSGEKCGEYRINRNAEREARRLREAQAAAAQACKRLVEALARAGALAVGETPPEVTPGAPADALDAYAAAAKALSTKLERKIANREALKHLHAASGGGHAGTWTGPAPETPEAPAAPPAPGGDSAEREARGELVSRLLTRLREATAEEAELVRSLSDRLLAAEGRAAVEALEIRLRHAIQGANAAADTRRVNSGCAEALLSLLRGLEGKTIIALREQLELIAENGGALPGGIDGAVAAARSEAVERSDREYVAHIFQEELRVCGYAVAEGGFETAFVRGGDIVAADERNPGYGVEIKADPETRKFEMRVVRLEEPGPWSTQRDQRDKGVQDRFCDSQQQVRDRMREAGIESWLTQHKPAGEVAVSTYAPPARRKSRVPAKKKPLRAAPLPRS